ncbi:SCO family protein [Paenibacillus sediminis]|uniref:Protein SCO1/2 n=1 Tax=Paenibacillus sediminis TaxID=664909 RepID=A0ABS4H5Y5_9BACL|nr:SCO family protein [Paenibacillus sediminis]MBP1937949.1 protein SCO1/2 [Paenibacillus sediminis]
MQLLKKYKWTWILLLICVILAGYLIIENTVKPKFPVINKVQDFTMENVDGKKVSLSDTSGKVRLFYFYFTSCPDVCPPTTFMLSEVQDLLKENGIFGKDASIVSITFDPQTDTREKIKQWAGKFNADLSGWYFLRGDAQQTKDFAKNSFKILIVGDNKNNFTHANFIALVDRDNNLRKLYSVSNTEEVNAKVIAQDVIDLARK